MWTPPCLARRSERAVWLSATPPPFTAGPTRPARSTKPSSRWRRSAASSTRAPIFRRLLGDPTIDAQSASKAALAILGREGFGKLVQDFVGVIAANRRLGVLRAIVAAFAALVADKRGVVVADVTTAHPLTDVQREQLRARLIEAGYGQVRIQEGVDPSLLGGLVLRVGARLYDTSLKSRLQRLQYAMKGAA